MLKKANFIYVMVIILITISTALASNMYDVINSGDLNQVKDFLQKNPDINQENEIGRTLLFISVEKNKKDIAEYLISQGANVNVKDKYGYTPLHLAVMNNSKELVELLISNGADLNAKNNNGMSPIYYTMNIPEGYPKFEEKKAMENFLISKGAEPLDNNVRILAICEYYLKNIDTALEMYCNEKGKYPEKLENLCPEYMKKIPLCPKCNKPYIYEPSASYETFILKDGEENCHKDSNLVGNGYFPLYNPKEGIKFNNN